MVQHDNDLGQVAQIPKLILTLRHHDLSWVATPVLTEGTLAVMHSLDDAGLSEREIVDDVRFFFRCASTSYTDDSI